MRPHRSLLLLLSVGVGPGLPDLHAQAILAPSGRSLFQGATLVRSFVQVNRFSLPGPAGRRDITETVVPLALVYGFYPQWTAIAALPYVDLDVSDPVHGSGGRNDSSGLADLQFLVQYDGLYSRNTPGGLTRLSGVFGVQVPTRAERFSAGAAQYTAGLIFEKQVNLKYVLTADFEYTVATENRARQSRGDGVRWDVVPGYFLITRNETGSDTGWLRKVYERTFRHGAYFILEFNGAWQDQARVADLALDNSGGATLSVSPGVQLFPSRSLLVEVSVPIPVVQELNGTQPKAKTGFHLGMRYLF